MEQLGWFPAADTVTSCRCVVAGAFGPHLPPQATGNLSQLVAHRGFDVLLMDGMNGTMLRNQGSMAADRAWIEGL